MTGAFGSAEGQITKTEPVAVSFRVELRVTNGVASMRVPKIATGGYEGEANWFPVKNYLETPGEFSGRVRFGLFAGSSTFRIDRRTGEISTSGGFSGTCTKQDLTQHKF